MNAYATVLQVTVTPDQLGEILRDVVRSELAKFTPSTPSEKDLPELLTRKEAARLLQVSLQTLNNWSKDTNDRSALLVHSKINNCVRYKRADVLATLQETRRFKKL